jgi:hypothetical protein
MKILVIIILIVLSFSLNAACTLIDGANKTPFDGKLAQGIAVEKKSLSIMQKEFPELGIIEKSFKGEVQACVNCTDKYITCSN